MSYRCSRNRGSVTAFWRTTEKCKKSFYQLKFVWLGITQKQCSSIHGSLCKWVYIRRGGTFKLPPRPDFSHRLLTQVSNTRWQVIAVAALTCCNHIVNNHQSPQQDLRKRDLSRSRVLTWWCENFIALVFYDCKILCFVIESERPTWHWISL